MAEGDTTAVTDPTVGQQTGTESSLSSWAGDYVTDMLGRGWAMADQPYEAYTGDLSAGASDLQTSAFQGLANLAQPTSYTDAGVAQRYMNPYIDTALQAQMGELQRQATLRNMQDAAQLTKAGAFGGSRQAIMNTENTRNLYDQMNRALAEGYSTAYDRGANQFNTEQGFGLQGLGAMLNAGQQQRAIEQEGISADIAQYEEERDFPYKQVQYMQSLLQGLPLAAQNYSYSQPSTLSTILGATGGIGDLYDQLFGSSGIFSGSGTTTQPTVDNTTTTE